MKNGILREKLKPLSDRRIPESLQKLLDYSPNSFVGFQMLADDPTSTLLESHSLFFVPLLNSTVATDMARGFSADYLRK